MDIKEYRLGVWCNVKNKENYHLPPRKLFFWTNHSVYVPIIRGYKKKKNTVNTETY